MKSFINKKVLITTQGWFFAPDGLQYKAVFGTLKAIHESGKELGFIPNRAHANWFIEVGAMVIMGCQVMYVIQVDEINSDEVEEWKFDEGKGLINYRHPTSIYITD